MRRIHMHRRGRPGPPPNAPEHSARGLSIGLGRHHLRKPRLESGEREPEGFRARVQARGVREGLGLGALKGRGPQGRGPLAHPTT